MNLLTYLLAAICAMRITSAKLESMAATTTVTNTKSYQSKSQQWLTSNYFRADNQNVISTYTQTGSQPNFTFTFSSPLPSIPYLAYGIKGYRSNDYLGSQFFEMVRLNLTQSSFSVQCQTFGTTNLWLFNSIYLAIDSSFPHDFFAFDNVPINVTGGDILNISSKMADETSFYQEINFTQLASGQNFSQFSQPISSNHLVLFLTSMWIEGTFGQPFKFHLTEEIKNTSHFTFNTTIYRQARITRIHLSIIIYNSDDVESSKTYKIEFYYWYNTGQPNFESVPEELVDNFIMGIVDFEMVDAACGLEYVWNWGNYSVNSNSSDFGAILDYSWTYRNKCGLSWSRSTVFYIKTWKCDPAYPFTNVTTQQCQTQCGGYTFTNSLESICEKCQNSQCYQCELPNNTQICTQCATFNHYEMNGTTCDCGQGYFETGDVCLPCSFQDLECSICDYDDGAFGALAFNESIFECVVCGNFSDVQLLNGDCIICKVTFCVSCSDDYECRECEDRTFLNLTTLMCDICPYDCLLCNSQQECLSCNSFHNRALDYNTSRCLPIEGFYDDSHPQASQCDAQCKSCFGGSNCSCLSCFEGFLLVNSTCLFCQEATGVDQCEVCVEIAVNVECSSCFVGTYHQGKCVQSIYSDQQASLFIFFVVLGGMFCCCFSIFLILRRKRQKSRIKNVVNLQSNATQQNEQQNETSNEHLSNVEYFGGLALANRTEPVNDDFLSK